MIKAIAQGVLGKFHLRLTRTNVAPDPIRNELRPFFTAIKGLGFDPHHIVDVGANRGNWTRCALEFFPAAHYTLIEPQPDLKRYIVDLVAAGVRIDWINVGVSDSSGQAIFNRNTDRDDAGSFIPPAKEARSVYSYREIPVELKTLDEIAAASPVGPPDLVKIDAEGFDLKALAGASSLFGRTEFFLVEVVIAATSYYENTLSAVVRKLDDAGYDAVDITSLNRSPRHGVLWLAEIAFIRKGSRLLSGIYYG
jgi:FkbM family methyltransferase